jgi:hypothetical protein
MIPFLNMFLGILIQRSHEVLKEDILKEMVRMSEVDLGKVKNEVCYYWFVGSVMVVFQVLNCYM